MKFKVGNKVKIIGKSDCGRSLEDLKETFPYLTGYVNFVSNDIIKGKEYVIILDDKDVERWKACGSGFVAENLKLIK